MKYCFRTNHFIETEILPNKLAIVGSESEIDWETLRNQIIYISDQFKNIGIPQGHPIIIYGHKECMFPVAMLACIHSNIPYIPIDKIYPVDRIKKIINSTGSQILFNCSEEHLDIESAITINSKLETKINHVPDYKKKIYCNTEDPLQYIIFTSGSTGEPKGVQITRSSVISFIDWAKKDFGFSGDDVFMNQAPFTFDVSLCDILNALVNGGTLVLTSDEIVQDPQAFFNRLVYYKCSVWTSTPSFIYLFLRHSDFKSENFPSIKTFLFMGEDLPNRTCAFLRWTFKDARILNAYGPTEATIVTTLVEINDDVIKQYPLLPIGYPMPECEILIDKKNSEDKEGELIIVGNHVSIGYLNNEEMNKQKFFIHKGKRAYRTGDLAYYENNMLFCKGRNDDQIKMHGYRIELNEITNTICKNDLISDAVTVGLKRNNQVKKIVSFVILKKAIIKEELIKQLVPFLERTLPYYMIPGDIDIVDKFPYNSSYKIDKLKLIDEYLKRQFN
ncbi:MAG: AMP-binding protein [Bacteroidales bacterium]|jgi:D-alanine--poly(phosphoribitol) ligase subunit 1